MPEEVRRLTSELHATNRLLRDVLARLDSIEGRAKTEWRRAWWHRLVSALLVVIVAAGLLFWRHDRIRECEMANEARADTRAAIVESLLAITAGTEDPERFAPMIDRVQTRLTRIVPDRTCPTGVLP